MKEILILTGVSGAGISTALNVLQDNDYDIIDNLPFSLLENYLAQEAEQGMAKPLALSIDVRNRQFDPDLLLSTIERLTKEKDYPIKLLYFDCDNRTLQRRFNETRRRHPLAKDRPVSDGVEKEKRLLRDLKRCADDIIDTSLLKAQDLNLLLVSKYRLSDQKHLLVRLVSFSYRFGLPRDADLVFDVRFLKNPHYDEVLRPHTGLSDEVGDYIKTDPIFVDYFESLKTLLKILLFEYSEEGKNYLTIAFGCTGGKHRSVYLARITQQWIQELGFLTDIWHREQNNIVATIPPKHLVSLEKDL